MYQSSYSLFCGNITFCNLQFTSIWYAGVVKHSERERKLCKMDKNGKLKLLQFRALNDLHIVPRARCLWIFTEGMLRNVVCDWLRSICSRVGIWRSIPIFCWVMVICCCLICKASVRHNLQLDEPYWGLTRYLFCCLSCRVYRFSTYICVVSCEYFRCLKECLWL